MAIKEVEYLNRLGHKTTLIISKISRYHNYVYQDLLKSIPHNIVVNGLTEKVCTLATTPFVALTTMDTGKESVVDLFSTFLTGIKTPKMDAVLCHDQFSGVAGLILHKLRGVPYLCYVHEQISTQAPALRISKLGNSMSTIAFKSSYILEEAILKDASHVMVNSQYGRDELGALFQCIGKKASIVYPGCEPLIKPHFSKQKYAIAVSRWGLAGGRGDDPRYRNALFIVEVAKRIKDMKLILAGSWEPMEDEYSFRRLLEAENLSNRVLLFPGISELRLRQLYANASILLHWTVERFGMCVLEAMACGCPVITIKGSGASEIMENEVQGFIAESRDPEEYANYIEMLLENNTVSRRMCLEAWRTAHIYSWRNHVKKITELLGQEMMYVSKI